jgi:two-component system, cell cycle sensor histidine kinase and response regulator CckA
VAQRAALARQVEEHSVTRSFEARLRVKSGDLRDVLIWAELIYLGGERCMIVGTQDITERKRAEESLRESEERFRQLADNINKVFWITDPENTRMIYVSSAYERIWGRTCASLYASPRSWFDAVHPDDRRVCQGQEVRKGVRDSVYRITRSDGAVRWVRDRAFPVRDSSGAIHRVAGIAEDITEQRALEDQLRQAQKMEAIGQLAGGIAHDFNNLLTVIQGHAALLKAHAITRSEIEEAAEQISLATQRAASVTRQLLMFGRRQVMQPRDVDINDVIERTGKMVRRILGEDIELVFHHASALPLVHADPGMIEQVLLNLAVNSRDAMPAGGQLTITTAPTVMGEEPPQPGSDITHRAAVGITVTDTGCGIAPENLSRVFEPFFTTKGVGKGTGLGLASAYGIIKQHQGWIRVSSEVNQGTTFQIGLPASRKAAPVNRAASSEAPIQGGTEGILLVEDEPSLRVLVRNVLKRYGYRVFEAASGKDALAVWQQHQGAIDLVLTDMVMPGGMSGRQLADELQRRRPALKIIFSSGYSAEVVGKGLVLEDGINFLQKPYDPRVLAAIVRSCLDAK